MAKRVFLHVGTPNSGTTYVQAVLWQNADALKRDGLLLPGRLALHYAAAKGVTTRTAPRHEVDVDVQRGWQRLARLSREWGDDALIGHELLAPASREQARAAKRKLGQTEVHLVLTVRALHRQLPASWQEQVKGGMALPFETFIDRVRDREARGEWFWEVQDTADIIARWAPRGQASRAHVVTVPVDSSDAALLWSRFAGVLGLDPAAYDSEAPSTGRPLGVVETELLRRVHAVRDGRFTDPQRHLWTRRILAGDVLAQRASAPIRLPDSVRPWLDARTDEIVETIRKRGYDVAGDLSELAWTDPPPDARAVSSVTEDEIDETSRWAIARLQEALVERQPAHAPPAVGPDDGVAGILELLEHIRATDTGETPRPPILRKISAVDRLRKTITAALRRR
jgi:hypothetical protein